MCVHLLILAGLHVLKVMPSSTIRPGYPGEDARLYIRVSNYWTLGMQKLVLEHK